MSTSSHGWVAGLRPELSYRPLLELGELKLEGARLRPLLMRFASEPVAAG